VKVKMLTLKTMIEERLTLSSDVKNNYFIMWRKASSKQRGDEEFAGTQLKDVKNNYLIMWRIKCRLSQMPTLKILMNGWFLRISKFGSEWDVIFFSLLIKVGIVKSQNIEGLAEGLPSLALKGDVIFFSLLIKVELWNIKTLKD